MAPKGTDNKGTEKKSAEELDLEIKRLEVMEKQLHVEDLQMRVENEKARRVQIARNHEAQQQSLEDYNRQVVREQEVCKHRKGGQDLEGILNGTDNFYSVVKNTYPWGELGVICTRCNKEWRKPSEELSKTNPELYAQQLAEYRAAINFPTDNQPSGTQIFLITKEPAPVNAVS